MCRRCRSRPEFGSGARRPQRLLATTKERLLPAPAPARTRSAAASCRAGETEEERETQDLRVPRAGMRRKTLGEEGEEEEEEKAQ